MTFMWKFTIVLIMTALLTDIISVAITAALPKSLATDLTVSLGISAAIAGIIGMVAGGAVGRALRDLQDVVLRFVKWDLNVAVPHVERSDEIGEIAKGLEIFKADAIRWSESYTKEQDTQVQGRLAAQHRTTELIRTFRDSIAGILSAFTDSARQMDETARLMSGVASDTNERMNALASASDQASTNVQTVAAAAEELAVSVNHIDTRVSTASEIVSQVTDKALTANQKVGGLAVAAQRIGDVVSLIQDVAAQTNLLALNATIEAARAGNAGRGFAVVASEVKTLADQTAKATNEIRQQIATIQGSTSAAVDAMNSIVVTMSEVSRNTQEIASAVQQQSAATSEISQGVRQAARGTEDFVAHMPNVTRAADETSQSAAHILEVSHQLACQADRLRGTVETFLHDVAATESVMIDAAKGRHTAKM